MPSLTQGFLNILELGTWFSSLCYNKHLQKPQVTYEKSWVVSVGLHGVSGSSPVQSSKADAVRWMQAGILITSISSHPVITRGSCGEEGGERWAGWSNRSVTLSSPQIHLWCWGQNSKSTDQSIHAGNKPSLGKELNRYNSSTYSPRFPTAMHWSGRA